MMVAGRWGKLGNPQRRDQRRQRRVQGFLYIRPVFIMTEDRSGHGIKLEISDEEGLKISSLCASIAGSSPSDVLWP